MIGTTKHKVSNANRFVEAVDPWLVIGGTDAWPDPENPPDPDPETQSINTVVGAKQATAKLVIQDDVNGDEIFIVDGITTKWTTVNSYQEALTLGARWVLLRATIQGLELPTTTFRELAFYSNLTRKEGVAVGQAALLPSEIEDYGVLETLEYRKAVNRDGSGVYEILAIIGF